MQSINNLGSTYLYITVMLPIMLLGNLVLWLTFSNQSKWFQRVTIWFQKSVWLSFYIRFFLQSYLQFALVGFINLGLILDTYSGNFSSTAVMAFLLLVISAVPIASFIALRKFRYDSENQAWFQRTLGSLTRDLNVKSTIGYYWQITFMLKRLATAAVIIYMRDVTALQIQALLLL